MEIIFIKNKSKVKRRFIRQYDNIINQYGGLSRKNYIYRQRATIIYIDPLLAKKIEVKRWK